MDNHIFYSIRKGINENADGYDLEFLKKAFKAIFDSFREQKYFDEGFGYYCSEDGMVPGEVSDVALEIRLKIRKEHLWPIDNWLRYYSEDDLLDMIEYLFLYVSKPIGEIVHSCYNCGDRWGDYDKDAGRKEYCLKINEALENYKGKYVLSNDGVIQYEIEKGYENLMEAHIHTDDEIVRKKIEGAISVFRSRGNSIETRHKAVRELADVLERLRPKIKEHLVKGDENDLFNIANNFEIRHSNEKQKNDYDKSTWLSWMFYFYLSTIHVVLRKIRKEL